MFEHFDKYRVILVTGPQRAGTRIMAKAIAHDTGHGYIDEDDFDVQSIDKFLGIIKQSNVVIHCPAMFHLVHAYATKDTLVAVVNRNIDDIIASEARIGWSSWNKKELKKYGARDTGRPLAMIKYSFWQSVQRALCKNAVDLYYDALEKHPLWIPKEQRTEFKAKQTS